MPTRWRPSSEGSAPRSISDLTEIVTSGVLGGALGGALLGAISGVVARARVPWEQPGAADPPYWQSSGSFAAWRTWVGAPPVRQAVKRSNIVLRTPATPMVTP